jgi:asparagine synthase (glutamine-hydrolysing)
MKGAFAAFLGDVEGARDLVDAAERRGLVSVDLQPGRVIFASEAMPLQRASGGTVILGDCFTRYPATGRAPKNCWGSYVAFTAESGALGVERAALTGMPVYWCRHPAGLACASDPALLLPPHAPVAIDWEFVGSTLAYINLRTERTGLVGVHELVPGTGISFDGTSFCVASTWSPWQHVACPTSARLVDIAPELAKRIIDCTAAWSASRHDIILELSGGLDSSIVAAALRAADGDFSAITFATPEAEGDERHFARAVASRCGIDLTEVVHDDAAIDLVSLPDVFTVRPGAYSVLGGLDRAFVEHVSDLSRPIFGGIGGDSVFHLSTTVAPILDVWSSRGWSRRTFATLRDVARASDATIWEAARLSWRAHRAGPRMGWRRDTAYLNPAALPETPFAHPWDEGAETVSQAKRNHAESIRRILDFLDRPRRWEGRDVVSPLLSQPIVELCLSIPSGSWFSGGRNRAVARAAFADRLPPQVVWRKGKGRMEALCAAAYMRQRAQLRELLLGGILAQRGLLDAPAIEAYLARDLTEGDFDYFRLIEIGDVERWVRVVASGVAAGSSLAQR